MQEVGEFTQPLSTMMRTLFLFQFPDRDGEAEADPADGDPGGRGLHLQREVRHLQGEIDNSE